MKLEFNEFSVKHYRSLLDVKVKIGNKQPTIICGENNIGKTNLLRAMDLFFNHMNSSCEFEAQNDIPHHVYYGSESGKAKTELVGYFKKNDEIISLKVVFDRKNNVKYFQGREVLTKEKAKEILSDFRFLFIESNNVNLPKLISVALENDGLSSLDGKRSKQTKALGKLEEFIKFSKTAISDIEKDINKCFEKLTDFDGSLKGKSIKINFAEFEKLRDVVKTMTSITLRDGNDHEIESKGSGAQRAVFLALMQYISENCKESIIWGVDEPEVFLHPKFQRKVFESFLKSSSSGQPIILTTHSQYFVKIEDLDYTYLFTGKESLKNYAKKPGKIFYETECSKVECASSGEKASLIKKHLGIDRNDGGAVMPKNIIVEGEEDQKYLEALFRKSDAELPNIIQAGGASKIGGYLQFYKDLAKELNYKPKFVCIFDNDDEGREQFKKIKPDSMSQWAEVEAIFIPRFDGKSYDGSAKSNVDWEMEDFLSPEMVFDAINKILKKDGYLKIKKSQIDDRIKAAHVDKQILKYAEECSCQNNPEKDPFIIDHIGKKLLICKEICSDLESFVVGDIHSVFVKKLEKILSDKK